MAKIVNRRSLLKQSLLTGVGLLSAFLLTLAQGPSSAQDAQMLENRTPMSGGEMATVEKATRTAFAQPVTNLDPKRRRIFSFGDRLFNTKWIEAPGSVTTLDGLGPLFNRSSCAGCHVRDGRGRPPLPHEDRMLSKLIRENIPEAEILGHADPGDQDQNGISGRPNYVWDVEAQERRLGRFGWKANQPTLRQQNASAFNGDIGLTTSLFPDPSCSEAQPECLEAKKFGDQPEVSDEFLEKLTTYVSLLAVPARRNVDGSKEQQGERIFYEAQCVSCHLPRQITGEQSEHPEHNNQVIHPYTDLLLHDMGEDLADQRPDFEASGSEWRTPPLWGIGLVKNVNKHTFFLHDGRARNLMEAVLWHGGEAQGSQEYVRNLPKADREALITFLNAL